MTPKTLVTLVIRSAIAVSACLLFAMPGGAAVVVDRDVLARLAGPTQAGARVVIPRLQLDDGSAVELEVQQIVVFAPDAVLINLGPDGPQRMPIPTDQHFAGHVTGEPDSWVFLALGSTLRGLVVRRGEVYAIAPEGDAYAESPPRGPSLVRKLSPESDRPANAPLWRCDSDLLPVPVPARVAEAARTLGKAPAALTSTVYAVNLALDTDYELYQKFGSLTGLYSYIGDLAAAASAIYLRDVNAILQVGTLYTYSTPSDPWSATDTMSALYEVGDYWHANHASITRTTVHFLSAKPMGGGIAWMGVLCSGDFPSGGHWGGGYGVSASLNGSFSTTNPALYWDILCFTHEVGHNFDSPHTECYSPPVDTCTPCDTFSCTGSVPAGGGTIMSYCHACSGGYNNIILYFGQPGQPSQAVTDLIRTYVESVSPCLLAVSAAPTVASVLPPSGPTTGGTSVTITGSNFASGATVTFGGTPATGVTFVNASKLTATTPPHSGGTVDVTVTNPGNASGSIGSAFTFTCAAPSAPTASAPANAASGASYSVSWTGTSPDNTYQLQEDTSASFTAPTTFSVTGTSLNFTHSVGSSTTYYYRVQATSSCGGSPYTSIWSNTVQTTVAPAIATGLFTLPPCRVFDTRNANGPLGGPAITSAERSFTVTGVCGIPASARSIAVNVTVTESDSRSWVAVFPGDITWPGSSTLNYLASQTRANNAIIQLASDGSGTIKVRSGTGTVHVILDVAGYFQ